MNKDRRYEIKKGYQPLLAAGIVFLFLMSVTFDLSADEILIRSGSVRPDGKLEFLGPGGVAVAAIDIEIAETAEARSKGLMGRSSLRMTDGMLFVFEQAEVRYFWMYNTPLSLDMIFINSEKRIVHIAESTLPMSTQTYGSQFPAQYVVEVRAGFVKFFKIHTGMRIQWQRR